MTISTFTFEACETPDKGRVHTTSCKLAAQSEEFNKWLHDIFKATRKAAYGSVNNYDYIILTYTVYNYN